MDSAEWDDRYRDHEMVWSSGPNMFVAQACTDLSPGRAIDLAAGEGRNAIWLAERGWDATAVDFSAVAVDKALAIARRRGVAITAEVADLSTYVPEPNRYDLVVVAYLQLVSVELTPILERAAAAVAPGGTFVLVAHDVSNLTGGYGGPQSADVLTTPEQVAAVLTDDFTINRAEVAERPVSSDAGDRTALDTVVVARRT